MVAVNVDEVTFSTTHGIVARPVICKLWISVKNPWAMQLVLSGPRIVTTISISPVSATAVPTGKVNVRRAASEIVPVVPRRTINVLLFVPAAVFDRQITHRNTVPMRSFSGGTASTEPVSNAFEFALMVWSATDALKSERELTSLRKDDHPELIAGRRYRESQPYRVGVRPFNVAANSIPGC